MNDNIIGIEKDRYPFLILEKAIFDDHRELNFNGNPVQISKHEILTYVAISYFADARKGTAFPSYRKISEVSRLGRSTVIEALKILVLFGYIKKKNRLKKYDKTGDIYQSSNIYTILTQYKVVPKKVVDNSTKNEGEGSPHGRGVVRSTDGGSPRGNHNEQELINKNKGNKRGTKRKGVVDNFSEQSSPHELRGVSESFYEELFSTYKIYSDISLNISDSEKKNLEELISKQGSEKVLDIWGNYQRQKPGKPVKFFVEDFGVYNKTIEKKVSTILPGLKNRPDICPVCKSKNLKLGNTEAFKCLDCDSFWELIDGEWIMAIEEAL